jgi:bifunctional non-homologous end joining protein LigD
VSPHGARRPGDSEGGAAAPGSRRRRAGGDGGDPNGTIAYPAIDGLPALVWAVNLAVLEFHVPMWRVDDRQRPLRPDLIVFDLDPGPPADLVDCCAVAVLLRGALSEDGLEPLPKTSGAKGLQLYARVAGSGAAADPLSYARALAHRIERDHPAHVVSNMRRDLRRGKVLIDWSQNNPAKTTVAPYSMRLMATPSVSTPVTWDEVAAVAADGGAERLRFTPEEVLDRVGSLGDLYALLSAESRR